MKKRHNKGKKCKKGIKPDRIFRTRIIIVLIWTMLGLTAFTWGYFKVGKIEQAKLMANFGSVVLSVSVVVLIFTLQDQKK
jgi:hypothetical protein